MKDIRRTWLQDDAKAEEILAAFYATDKGKELISLLNSGEIDEEELQKRLEPALRAFMNKE